MFVSTMPGQIVDTPMSWPASSARRQSDSMNTAALLVAYAARIFTGRYAATELTLTMWPPSPRCTISSPNARQPWITPHRFTSSTRRHSSVVVARNVPEWPIPALFTTVSGTPYSAATEAANSRIAASSETSTWYAYPPAAEAVRFALSASMSAHTTSAPAPANARAVVRPMPLPAPRSEEHTSELQSRGHLVCRLLL